MFKRRWKYFGKLKSDKGAELRYGHKSVTYCDDRGSFEFGFEDGYLFSKAFQVSGTPIKLDEKELSTILELVVSGLRSDGQAVELYPNNCDSNA